MVLLPRAATAPAVFLGALLLELVSANAPQALGGASLSDFAEVAMLRNALLELLPTPSHQWCVVALGFCVNVALGFYVWRHSAGSAVRAKETFKVSRDPRVSDSCEGDSPRSPSSPTREAQSFQWLDMMCCSGTGASSPMKQPTDGGAPLWLRSDDHIHPKFCGNRLREPGNMPDLARFRFEALGQNVPSHWEYLLPHNSDAERHQCRELRARITNVPGSKDHVTMLRFLRARQGRLEAAADMFKSAMRWRTQTNWEEGFRMNTKDDTLHRQVDSCWPPSAILGTDHDGDPVYWNRLGLGRMDFLEEAPAQFLVEHEVYTITRIMQAMEESSRLTNRPVMYMTVVVDLADLGMRSFNLKALAKYRIIVRVMEDNFPELVKRIVVVRAPRLAYALWNIAQNFFDEGTRAKIQIADSRSTLKVLCKFMDKKWVPEALGGTHRIAGSAWCEPCIPAPRGPPSKETMSAIKAAYTDEDPMR
eukprot:TRINITY_DN90568_c0_g1_i1.p1 TRINITY_DN90568_c0_g1~~TRINITY_DN90568_c0_g1_i1.p1  ORF type:complete len:477 (+),score=81.52 TRINITY_DN90568_c0_g1_i1:87-1517(+)